MDLPSELFADVVAATAATAAPVLAGRAGDRRRPRARTAAAVAVCPWDDPLSALSLHVRDVSAGGVGLLHRRRMPLDAAVVVRLPRSAGDSVPVLGRVVYWEPLAPDRYAIGVHFDRVVTEAELTARTAGDPSVTPAEANGVIGRITHAISRSWRKAS